MQRYSLCCSVTIGIKILVFNRWFYYMQHLMLTGTKILWIKTVEETVWTVWESLLSFLQITFANAVGRFDVDVTTFQMAVLFAWNQRPFDRISYENLRLATELPDPELRRTLWVCRDSLFFTFTYIIWIVWRSCSF